MSRETKPRKSKTVESKEVDEMNKFTNRYILDLSNVDQLKKVNIDNTDAETEGRNQLLKSQKEMYEAIANLLENNKQNFKDEKISQDLNKSQTINTLEKSQSFEFHFRLKDEWEHEFHQY